MAGARDNISELEKLRLQLEDTLKQLQRSLQHWQTWDAEYENLKEEVEAAPDACTPQDLRRIHNDFDGELLKGKEIDEIFGLQDQRPKSQIVNVLQRRIDYVGKNVDSLHKQMDAAQLKLADATVVSFPEAVDEHGQPVTEIIEQLDDDDNVLSYELKRPGDAMQGVQEALKKAGIDDISNGGSGAVAEVPETETKAKQLPIRPKPAPANRQAKKDSPAPPATSVKKSVSFSEDVQEAPAAPVEPQDMSIRARRLDEIMRNAREQENLGKQQAVTPGDESIEDAELRRQMLQYSMSEVGAVVGELELEEADTDDDSGIEYGEDDFDEDDDGEDAYGRSTGRMVTDEYKERMLQLEQRLGIKSRFTESASRQAGGDTDDDDGDDDGDENNGEGIGRIVVKKADRASSASKPPPTKSIIKEGGSGEASVKAGVRFANELDIAPGDEPSLLPSPEKKAQVVEPLGDVVERTSSSKPAQTAATSRPSRFKRAREGAAPIPKGPLDAPSEFLGHDERTVPRGPEGSTIADKLVERDTSSSVMAPDEYDDAMIHQEIADEHQRMRRRFIQREGGFLKEDESPIQSLEDEGKEPVSRFKAARLSRQ